MAFKHCTCVQSKQPQIKLIFLNDVLHHIMTLAIIHYIRKIALKVSVWVRVRVRISLLKFRIILAITLPSSE